MKYKYPIYILLYFVLTLPVYIFAFNLLNNPLIINIIYAIISILVCICILLQFEKHLNKINNTEKTMLYSILEDLDTMIVVWAPHSPEMNVNTCFLKKTGFSEEDLRKDNILSSIFDVSSNYDYDKLANEIIKVEHKSTLKCKDGKELIVLWKTTNTAILGEKPLYMSIGIDLTDFYHMQDLLVKSEKQFDLSMNLSGTGLIFRYIGSDKYLISDNLKKEIGLGSDLVSLDELISHIHPEDRSLFESYYKINENMKNPDDKRVKTFEIRFDAVGGGYHWYSIRYKYTDIMSGDTPAIGGSIVDISKDKEKDTLIEKIAYIDDITQIFNRSRLITIGSDIYDCVKATDTSYYIIVFDVDRFHIINNVCGYQNGNKLLKDIAIQILKNMSDEAFCARIGGDSFCVIMNAKEIDDKPTELIKKIQRDIFSLSTNVFSNQTITMSAGYCKIPQDGSNFAEALEHAEFALRLGDDSRSNITRYDNTIKEKIIKRANIEKELDNAIANNEFVLYYQPKIDLNTNRIIGCEALIRWIKPDGSLIPPNDFIPIAESSHLITQISNFVVHEACRQNKIWQSKGFPPISVSVNLSSVDFYQTDVCKTIRSALNMYKLDPEWLEIELTEGLALQDVENAVNQMKNLQNIGIKISMDDFGTGYSSLSYLQILPISILKLDRSFIMNLENDVISRKIVSNVINICKIKEICIVAEGIETKGQASILKESGCDVAQGFYFGRPMPASELETHFQSAIS